MTQPLGMDDFFTLEAGEYLERLTTLMAVAGPPNADELVRFSRALRGGALMASHQPIARAASGLERLLRSYRDGKRSWGPELAALVREAVDVLRTLVERVRQWTPDDTARADRLALQLEGNSAPVAAPAPAAAPSSAGLRAFLAREAASLATVLDQAARALPLGTAAEPIQAVLRRMQPLRGLAALSDFPPLPDLLDGVERSATGVARLEISSSDGAARFAAAARALGRAARDIAEHGSAQADAAEFRGFASLLLAPEAEPEVVPIESLFFAGDTGIVQRGTVPRGTMAASLGAAAAVSRGEHLVQTAEELTQVTSDAQRDLRLHVLLGDLRTLSDGLPSGLDLSVDAFGTAARGAITRGAAAAMIQQFSALVREAGVRLRGFSEVTQPATLGQVFAALVAEMERLGAVAPLAALADDESDVVPIESLCYDEPALEEEPVPIETLLLPPEAEPVPIEALLAAPEAADGEWDLAAAYLEYEALAGIRGQGQPDLDALMGSSLVVSAPVAAPVMAAVPLPAAKVSAVTARPIEAAPELPVVDIATLCYSGREALERAAEVRRAIGELLGDAPPGPGIAPLLDELLDLVDLARVN